MRHKKVVKGRFFTKVSRIKCRVLFILFFTILLNGCSIQNESANHPITTSERNTGVICNDCDPSYGVSYHSHDYIITSKVVTNIGREIGVVSASDQQGLGGWHTPPVGTKLYEIVGTPLNEAIAVEISPGLYKKAVIKGWFPLDQ